MKRTLVFVSLMAMALACSQSGETGDAPSALIDGQLRLSKEVVERGGIRLVDVQTRPLRRRLEASGRLELNEDQTAHVGSPTEGPVVEVRARLGESLRRGAPMVSIHSHELIAARSDYDNARAQTAAAAKNHRFALAESERAQRLLDAKALSLRDRQAADTALAAAVAEVERSASEVSRAERLMHHLGVTDVEAMAGEGDDAGTVWVRAPMSGTVLERNVTVGAVVNPSDTLAIVSDLSTLWAVAEIPERQAGIVRKGMRVSVRVAAFDTDFPGTIFQVSGSLDPSLRTVSVRAEVNNDSGQLRAEMYAVIIVDLGETEPVIAVPTAAMQQIDGQSIVFIGLEDDLFELRRVEAGEEVDGWVRILSGLEVSERVVSEGSFLVKSELLRSSFEEE